MRALSPIIHVAMGVALLTAATPNSAHAQRRGSPSPDAVTSDSLYTRVAGADRKMNLDEFSALMKERPALSRAGELPSFVDSVFKRLDTDSNGWLSRPEFAAVARSIQFAAAS